MGAGKSTVGARCAAALGREFVDTDEVVAAIAGRPVPELFATDGERAFRALERTALADALASPAPSVIATGGGAVLDPENRKQLRAHAFVVWLDARPDQLAARVGSGDDRPLLRGDPAGALRRLDAVRRPVYEAVADAVVDTGDRAVDAVVADVLERVTHAQERVS